MALTLVTILLMVVYIAFICMYSLFGALFVFIGTDIPKGTPGRRSTIVIGVFWLVVSAVLIIAPWVIT